VIRKKTGEVRKMNEQIRESLSALMDGEANELEIERVLKHADAETLRSTWMRYHLVRHTLREGGAAYADIDVSAGVMAVLSGEPGIAIKPVARWKQFLQPAASFAVAASVFAAVLVGSQFYGLLDKGTDVNGVPELAARVSTVGMVNTLGGSAVRAGYASPALKPVQTRHADYNRLARQRLQRYMLSHTEEASLNAPQGMMPYARVATFKVED
jgi:sigma-E factor negative regulatory protein RseA